jgi:succinate-acetate transporter protein
VLSFDALAAQFQIEFTQSRSLPPMLTPYFHFVAFSTFGAFWFAEAALLLPDFGVSAAYADHPGQLSNAVGIFLASYFILTFILV